MARGPADDPTSMSTEAVDDVFKGLAGALDEFLSAPDVVAEESATNDGVDDDSLEPSRGPQALGWPDPQRALRLARLRLASDVRRRRASVAREFAAWWADLASVALDAIVKGVPVQVVRAAAGDPSAVIPEGDLPRLSGASSPREEELVFVDGLAPDHRRDQVWGDDWTQHQVPALPSAAELSNLLTRCGLPPERVAEVRQAREAVADALGASKRLGVEPDNEALMGHTEQLTSLLIDYARQLTGALRKIWSAAR